MTGIPAVEFRSFWSVATRLALALALARTSESSPLGCANGKRSGRVRKESMIFLFYLWVTICVDVRFADGSGFGFCYTEAQPIYGIQSNSGAVQEVSRPAGGCHCN